jgi:hypothetical protein
VLFKTGFYNVVAAFGVTIILRSSTMRRLIPALLFVSLTGAAFGQGQGHSSNGVWSLGGFGSILYPATGHAPTATPPIGQFASNGFSHGFANPGHASHPQHGAAVIVPYPVYYGGYYGGGNGYYCDPTVSNCPNGYGAGYAPGYTDDGSQSGPGLPSVVINQNFVPPQANPQVRDYTGDQPQQQPQDQSGLKLYQAPPSHPYADAAAAAQRPAASDQPTIYLIALRDHTIVQALGYWMEGSTLHYVSAEQTLNQLSIDLVDRDLSQRLNNERGLDFRLPQPR